MPESTPIYGFTYPCPGETVAPLAFATLANQIDAKLAEVGADAFLAANRFNVDHPTSPLQVIPVNVETALTSALTMYTAPVAGVYVVHAVVADDGTAATMTFFRAVIRNNGTPLFRHGQATPGNSARPAIPVGPIVAAAGDVFSVAVLFNGSGTVGVTCQFDAKMIVRIA